MGVVIGHKFIVQESTSNTPNIRAKSRMLPKLVTRNVTNDRGEGDRGIEFDNRNHSQIDGSRKNETLENH